MTDERKFKVTDKRRAGPPPDESGAEDENKIPEGRIVDEEDLAADRNPDLESDLINRLAYLQADFDNYRKRMMREQAEIARRGEARVLERILPVLDNFERALEHESEGSSLHIVHREFMSALAAEGLTEIQALGAAFDPRFHDAVETHEDEAVTVPTVSSVHRRGYMHGEKVLRPAMVGVANPLEDQQEAEG